MLSYPQVFPHLGKTLGTSLTCAIGVDSLEVHPTLPTYPFSQRQKLSECGIHAFGTQHSSIQSNCIQVFSKDSVSLVAQFMSSLKVEVFKSVANVVMQPRNFYLCLFPVMRTFLLSCGSTLQQFQLAMSRFAKLWTFYITCIIYSQKPLQSKVYSNCSPMYSYIWNRYVTSNSNDYIPLGGATFRQNAHLFYNKPIWDRAMHIDRDKSYFWQLNVMSSNWTFLKLGKQKRLELSNRLEARKPEFSLLAIFPSIMQTLNRVLKHLRVYERKSWIAFFCYRQILLLIHVARKWGIRWNNILFQQRTPINRTFATIHPIFEFPQSIVICSATTLQPIKHCGLLAGIWIDSIGVVHCEHIDSLALLDSGAKHLNIKMGDSSSIASICRGCASTLSAMDKESPAIHPDAAISWTARGFRANQLKP